MLKACSPPQAWLTAPIFLSLSLFPARRAVFTSVSDPVHVRDCMCVPMCVFACVHFHTCSLAQREKKNELWSTLGFRKSVSTQTKNPGKYPAKVCEDNTLVALHIYPETQQACSASLRALKETSSWRMRPKLCYKRKARSGTRTFKSLEQT